MHTRGTAGCPGPSCHPPPPWEQLGWKCQAELRGWAGGWQRLLPAQPSPGAGRELCKERRETRGGEKRSCKKAEVLLAAERVGQGSPGLGGRREKRPSAAAVSALQQGDAALGGPGVPCLLVQEWGSELSAASPGGFSTSLPSLGAAAFCSLLPHPAQLVSHPGNSWVPMARLPFPLCA